MGMYKNGTASNWLQQSLYNPSMLKKQSWSLYNIFPMFILVNYKATKLY